MKFKQLLEDLKDAEVSTSVQSRRSGKRGDPLKKDKVRDDDPGLSVQQEKGLHNRLGKLSRMIKRGTIPRTDRPKKKLGEQDEKHVWKKGRKWSGDHRNDPGLEPWEEENLYHHAGKVARMIKRGTVVRTDRKKQESCYPIDKLRAILEGMEDPTMVPSISKAVRKNVPTGPKFSEHGGRTVRRTAASKKYQIQNKDREY